MEIIHYTNINIIHYMKRIKLVAAACVAMLFLTACSQSHKDEPQDLTPREVSLSLGGEFVETSFQPMSRAVTGAQYYGINVYKDGKHYAYGVFTSEENMTLTLTPGSKYDFECTAVQDDRHKIAKINDNGGMFKRPFLVGNKEDEGAGFALTNLNKFVYSPSEFLTGIKSAKSTVVDGDVDASGYASKTKEEKYHPSQYRFYGELKGYTLDSSSSITIPLKCASFQIEVGTTEVPDGVITWQEESSSRTIDFSFGSLTPGNISHLTTYAFDRPDLCWTSTDANPTAKDFKIKFVWTRDGGNTKEGTDAITVKRNTKTVVTLNLEGKDRSLQMTTAVNEPLFESTINDEVTVK